MSNLAVERWVSPEEYLEFEEASSEKHEYINGEIYAMAGANYEHIRLSSNLSFLFVGHLRERPCDCSGSDLKVYNPASGSFFYPDLTIICDEPIFHGRGKQTVINPLIVIEILSPSTEAFDRGDKFAHYRMLESLQVYVLVSQKKARIEVHTRQGEEWKEVVCEGMESVLTLEAIEFSTPLSEIYRQVKFPPPRPSAKRR